MDVGNNRDVYTTNITLEGGNLIGTGWLRATSMSNGVYANGAVTVRSDGYLNATGGRVSGGSYGLFSFDSTFADGGC